MKSLEKPRHLLRVPKLTRTRMILALAVAIITDTGQFLLGPLGWAFGDQLTDVVAMLLVSWLIGFHWLLLPTFVLELVPLIDEFPTWTACVIAVIILRRREQRSIPSISPRKASIDV